MHLLYRIIKTSSMENDEVAPPHRKSIVPVRRGILMDEIIAVKYRPVSREPKKETLFLVDHTGIEPVPNRYERSARPSS